MRALKILPAAILTMLMVGCGQAPLPTGGEMPVEHARYFANGGNFFQDIPEGFPALELPAAFQVMGSQDRSLQQKLIVSTTMQPSRAMEALVNALLTLDGWVLPEGYPVPGPPSSGILLLEEQARLGLAPVSLCHPEQGAVILRQEAASVFSLTYSGGAQSDGRRVAVDACVQGDGLRMVRLQPIEPLADLIPTLVMPSGTLRDRGRNQSFPSRSRDRISRGGIFLSPRMTSFAVERDLARQLRAQGWQQDARWHGAGEAGSQWLRSPNAQSRLLGWLTVISLGEANQVEVLFELNQIPSQ